MSVAEAAPLGHNNPPEPTILETLLEKNKDLLKRMADAIKGGNEAPKDIANDIDQGKVSEVVKALRGVSKALEAERVKEKEPFLEGGKKVDGFFNTKKDDVDKLAKTLNDKAEAYSKKKDAEEKARLEELGRLKREAEEAALRRAQEAQDALNDDKRLREEAELLTEQARQARDAAGTEQEKAGADLDVARAELATIRSEIAKTKLDYKVKERDGVAIDEAERETLRTAALQKLEAAKQKVTQCESALTAAREKAKAALAEQRKNEEALAAAKSQERGAAAVVKTHLNEAVRHSEQAERIETKVEAKPADRARTLSEHGAIATLQQSWKWDVTDRTKLDKEALWPFIPEEVLKTAVGKWMHLQPTDKRKMAGAYMEQETVGQIL